MLGRYNLNMLKYILLIIGILFMFVIYRMVNERQRKTMAYGGVFLGVLFLYFIVPILDLIFLKDSNKSYVLVIQNASPFNFLCYVLLVLLFFGVFSLCYSKICSNYSYQNVECFNDEENLFLTGRLSSIACFIGWSSFIIGGMEIVVQAQIQIACLGQWKVVVDFGIPSDVGEKVGFQNVAVQVVMIGKLAYFGMFHVAEIEIAAQVDGNVVSVVIEAVLEIGSRRTEKHAFVAAVGNGVVVNADFVNVFLPQSVVDRNAFCPRWIET